MTCGRSVARTGETSTSPAGSRSMMARTIAAAAASTTAMPPYRNGSEGNRCCLGNGARRGLIWFSDILADFLASDVAFGQADTGIWQNHGKIAAHPGTGALRPTRPGCHANTQKMQSTRTSGAEVVHICPHTGTRRPSICASGTYMWLTVAHLVGNCEKWPKCGRWACRFLPDRCCCFPATFGARAKCGARRRICDRVRGQTRLAFAMIRHPRGHETSAVKPSREKHQQLC